MYIYQKKTKYCNMVDYLKGYSCKLLYIPVRVHV